AAEGDQSILVAGSPPGIPGSTNALRIHTIGDAAKGVTAAYQDSSDSEEDPLAGYGVVAEAPITREVPIVDEGQSPRHCGSIARPHRRRTTGTRVGRRRLHQRGAA